MGYPKVPLGSTMLHPDTSRVSSSLTAGFIVNLLDDNIENSYFTDISCIIIQSSTTDKAYAVLPKIVPNSEFRRFSGSEFRIPKRGGQFRIPNSEFRRRGVSSEFRIPKDPNPFRDTPEQHKSSSHDAHVPMMVVDGAVQPNGATKESGTLSVRT